MKKFYAILCLAIASLTQLQAQAPQGFNYQATVRNSSGDLIVNTNVYFKFNVIQGSQTAVPIFTETHYVPTDDAGQISLVIGEGTPSIGVFSDIDWSSGSLFLGIELNTGNGYIAMGTTQFYSVPYALYAESAGSGGSSLPNGTNDGDRLIWDTNTSSWIVVNGNNSSTNIEIITGEINNITAFGASIGGGITSDGGSSIVAKGIVWDTSPDPEINLNTQTYEGGGASSFISDLTNLSPSTNYYYRAYAKNSVGTSYGNTYTFTTSDATLQERLDYGETPYQIYLTNQSLLEDLYGLSYQGGLIFYLDVINGTGMVAAPTDQGTAQWGCLGTYIANASNSNIGAGNQNTNLINTLCNETGIAAEICANLTLNGYDDWYLPSKDELNLLFTNLHQRGLGSFDITTVDIYGYKGVYWSSTDGETSGGAAWIQMFDSQGIQYTYDLGYKTNNNNIRAVRSF
jgi:hypothetical protein